MTLALERRQVRIYNLRCWPQGLSYSEESLSSHLEARNAMINTSFRRLVETAVKVMEFNKGDKVERLPALDAFAPLKAKEWSHSWCGKAKWLVPVGSQLLPTRGQTEETRHILTLCIRPCAAF